VLRLLSTNNVFNLLIFFLFFLGLRIVTLFTNELVSFPELTWLTLADKLGENRLIYHQLESTLSPLCALLYYFIDILFGKSFLAHRIVASCFVFFHAIMFQKLCADYKLFPKKTFLPFYFYLLFSCFHQEFLYLSPKLLATTFVISLWYYLFDTYKQKTKSSYHYTIGFLLGLSTMCYFNYILLIVPIFVCFFRFSTTTRIKSLRFLLGFFIPYIFLLFYYYYFDATESLYHQLIASLGFQQPITYYFSLTRNLLLFISPLALLCLGLLSFFKSPLITKVDKDIHYSFLLFGVFLLLISCLDSTGSMGRFQLLIPFFTFFSTFYFIAPQRQLVKNISFSILSFLIIYFGLFFNSNYLTQKKYFDFSGLYLSKTTESTIKDKKVLVLGDGKIYWNNNTASTRFINWNLSKKYFDGIDDLKNQLTVYNEFALDMPEVIVDLEEKMPLVFEKIPSLKVLYAQKDRTYFLKE